MQRGLIASLGCLFLTTTFLAAQGGDQFYGRFLGKSFDGTREMLWVLLRNKDGITISASIKDAKDPKSKKSPRNLGLGAGRDIKLNGDKLEFTLQWAQSQTIKGPADAKYVAVVKGDQLIVNWTAGNEKGELTAKNENPAVAKKDDTKDAKKDDKKAPGSAAQNVYLSGLMDSKGVPIQKGTITQLAIIIVGAKSSKAEFLKVTADTKFIVKDGDDPKTYNQKTVLDDPNVSAAFRERQVSLERQGNVAITVTATAVKKK